MKIKIKTIPNSSQEKIEKIGESEYKVYLKKPAREGKANIVLVKLLKKYFGKSVRIISGETSRVKIVEVE